MSLKIHLVHSYFLWKICSKKFCEIFKWTPMSKSFKVARVVKLKLAFVEWFFYNLVILIKLQNSLPKFRQALLFPRNQAICLKISKFWRAPTATKFNIFFWNYAHVSYLRMSANWYSGFFLFFVDLELFIKM